MPVFVHLSDIADPPGPDAPLLQASLQEDRAHERAWIVYYHRFETSTSHRRRDHAVAEIMRSGYRQVSPADLEALCCVRRCPGYPEPTTAQRARVAQMQASAAKQAPRAPQGAPLRLEHEIAASRRQEAAAVAATRRALAEGKGWWPAGVIPA